MNNKLTCKNKDGHTIKDLLIDYEKKTFKQGNLFFGGATIVTKKFLYAKIEELKTLGFKEIKE